jgi:hypothetical protein
MSLTVSPTELTTSATDVVLAIECVAIMASLRRSPTGDRWKIGLWCWVFGLLTLAFVLGAMAHGVVLSAEVQAALWGPLYLSLGLAIGLFLVGAVYDWRGRNAARRLVPWCIGLGLLFFGVTEILKGKFIIFVLYEAVAMTAALVIYSCLAASRRLQGAAVMATAIVLNLVAAGIQASNVSFTLLVPFDHNGVFHLVQMLGIGTLWMGLRLGMIPTAR